MKRNKTAFCAVILALCLCMTFVLQPSPAQAASKPATNLKGKYLYYSCFSDVYRMDTTTGKSTFISKANEGRYQHNIAYYKGYFYWQAAFNDQGYMQRMNAKSGKIQMLKEGCGSPLVYNNKIYYSGDASGEGIFRMDLNGKNKKRIISKATGGKPAILNNRIYFCKFDGTKSGLYSADLSGKGIRRESSEGGGYIYSDGRDIYYTTENAVHRISGKTRKDTKLPNLSWTIYTYIQDVYNGVIYFTDYSGDTSKLKKYVVSKGTTSTLKTFKEGYRIRAMWAGQGSYMALSVYCPPKGGWMGEIRARIKKDGSGYKALQTKYWIELPA